MFSTLIYLNSSRWQTFWNWWKICRIDLKNRIDYFNHKMIQNFVIFLGYSNKNSEICTISQELYIIWSYYLIHMYKWWYLQAFFFFIFFNFDFLGFYRKCKKYPEMKINNYICHAPYLRNSIAYDHDFWYTCVKSWYLQ